LSLSAAQFGQFRVAETLRPVLSVENRLAVS
jgi:hypothetical protein